MLVKIFIKRRFKKGKVKEISAILKDFRVGAMDRLGYVSGETLVSYDDPQNVLVIGTWQDMESWLAWKDNPRRKEFESMLEMYQEDPTEYEAFMLGVPPQL
ncbi:MAG: antibiotic biosynthesis monooxygenase [Desulfosarcina sp.]|nr:antibiotic biosynthesis monooxygenase [Desulfobacterales bacterium]